MDEGDEEGEEGEGDEEDGWDGGDEEDGWDEDGWDEEDEGSDGLHAASWLLFVMSRRSRVRPDPETPVDNPRQR